MGVIPQEVINLNDRSGRFRDIDRRQWVSTSSMYTLQGLQQQTIQSGSQHTTSRQMVRKSLLSLQVQAKRNRSLLEGKRGRDLHQTIRAAHLKSPLAGTGRLYRAEIDPQPRPVYAPLREKVVDRSWTAYCLTAVSDQWLT